MRSGDQLQAVGVIELFRDVLPEGVAGPAGRDAPPAPIIGVGPKQVAHGAFVGHFLDSVQLPNVIQGVDGRGESAMQTKDLSKYLYIKF